MNIEGCIGKNRGTIVNTGERGTSENSWRRAQINQEVGTGENR